MTLQKCVIWTSFIVCISLGATIFAYLILNLDEIRNDYGFKKLVLCLTDIGLFGLTARVILQYYLETFANLARDQEFYSNMALVFLVLITSNIFGTIWSPDYIFKDKFTALTIIALINLSIWLLFFGLLLLVSLGVLLRVVCICDHEYHAIEEEQKITVKIDGYMTFQNVNDINTKPKETKCHLCHADYQTSDVIKVFPCSHYFHQTCVEKNKVINCPLDLPI